MIKVIVCEVAQISRCAKSERAGFNPALQLRFFFAPIAFFAAILFSVAALRHYVRRGENNLTVNPQNQNEQ